MARLLFRLLGESNTPSSVADTSTITLNSDLVIILAALLCALICVLGLIAVSRCVWLCRLAAGNRFSSGGSGQSPGRAISDNVLITHETLHYLKTSNAIKNCSMAVKTDMSKAYDRLEWNFIQLVLERLGFHYVWVARIMTCIRTVSYSYLVNDSVQGSVLPSRGIRQGDPLSPYLFILCSEVLSGLCKRAQQAGLLSGIRVVRGSPRVNHLLFVDDTMFFIRTDELSCSTLHRILQQ